MPQRWQLGAWRAAALVVAALLALRVAPGGLYATLARAALVGTGSVVATVAAPPRPADPVREAVLNVTSDFDELTHLLCDFMRSQPPEAREAFRAFMAERATRSYPRLEGLLDWLLSLYKFVFPFLVISMLARLGGGGPEGHAEHAEHAEHAGGWGAERGGGSLEGPWPRGHAAAPAAGLRDAGGGGWGGAAAGLARRESGEEGEEVGPGPKLGRLSSRTLPRTVSGAGAERGVPAPSTPQEGARNRGLPLHPAQLQGMRAHHTQHAQHAQHAHRQFQEVHALVRSS